MRTRNLLICSGAVALSLVSEMSWAQQGGWTATSLANAPSPREWHTAVWTGSKMIVWGGQTVLTSVFNDTGGIYDPASDSWSATTIVGAPAGRVCHSAVWTGSKMIVWGGWTSAGPTNTGATYDPATDSWTTMTTAGAPASRAYHRALWTGSRMLVWGGATTYNGQYFNSGGIYDPATDTWAPMSTVAAPPGRRFPTAVWTGSKMIVWGGDGPYGQFTNTGGVYDPVTDTWTPTATAGAPEARTDHSAVWTGSRMIVWGGEGSFTLLTGGSYDPATDSWTATATDGAPQARRYHTATWTGSKMLVWGGTNGGMSAVFNSGSLYDPAARKWTEVSLSGAPTPRYCHSAVWTGSRAVVWGGMVPSGTCFNDGASFAPGNFVPLAPCRVADTRLPPGVFGGPALGANAERSFPVAGQCGVPSGAKAVAINVTVVDATEVGDLRLFADGTVAPLASTINFTPARARANNAVVPVGVDGQIAVQCDMAPGSKGSTHFLFDVTGYFQ